MKKQKLVLTDEPFLLPQFVREVEGLKQFATKTYYTRAVDADRARQRRRPHSC
jgi:hypothetical protein